MNGTVRTETGGLWESQRLLPVTPVRGREGEREEGERVGGWLRLKGEGRKEGETLTNGDRGKKERKCHW